ncbi:MAG: cobalt ECF transporter T component CbiQ [Candidatus Accumulibacter sp.]|nr:cobalt ECF transporter T component CbiQ [Accumulibacter sp.]
MLIDLCAYSNRWRAADPAAKGLFALSGLVSAFAAGNPLAAAGIGAIVSGMTVWGAGIPFSRFFRAALAPLCFFLLGALSLACSVDYRTGDFIWLPGGWTPVGRLAARSCGALASLLFFALTTPMTDQIALFRRLRLPETLIEIMVLCYRMLFVFSEALRDIHTAQDSRLGYASPSLALRSTGNLAAVLVVQVWQRARALHLGALSRNGDGVLRFLGPVFANARRDMVFAFAGSALLFALLAVMP